MECKIFFRADGNSNIGLGHIYRLLALVDMLKDNFDCYFVTRCPLVTIQDRIASKAKLLLLPDELDIEQEASYIADNYLTGHEIVVLDGYNFTTTYQKVIKRQGTKLVCIDDLHSIHFVADAVINHNPAIQRSDYSKEHYTKLYIGFDYLLLRAAFLKAINAAPTKPQKLQEAFVCLGGADPYKLYKKAVEGVIDTGRFERIHLVVGSNVAQDITYQEWMNASPIPIQSYYNIDEHKIIDIVKLCSLAICTPSTVCLEMLCLRVPIVVGWVADNQKKLSSFIDQKGLAFSIQNFKECSMSKLQAGIIQTIAQDQIQQQVRYIKNDSTEFIRAVFDELTT